MTLSAPAVQFTYIQHDTSKKLSTQKTNNNNQNNHTNNHTMHLSLRSATVLLHLLLHGAQSAADEQLLGRHLRRNKNKSSPSLGLEESDKVSSPRMWLGCFSKCRTASCKLSHLSNVHSFLLQHTDYHIITTRQ